MKNRAVVMLVADVLQKVLNGFGGLVGIDLDGEVALAGDEFDFRRRLGRCRCERRREQARGGKRRRQQRPGPQRRCATRGRQGYAGRGKSHKGFSDRERIYTGRPTSLPGLLVEDRRGASATRVIVGRRKIITVELRRRARARGALTSCQGLAGALAPPAAAGRAAAFGADTTSERSSASFGGSAALPASSCSARL